MARQQITQIINPSAEKQVDRITEKLQTSNQVLLKNVESAMKLSQALSGAKGLKEVRVNVEALSKANKELNGSAQQSIKLSQERERLRALKKRNDGIDIQNANKKITLESKEITLKEKKLRIQRRETREQQKASSAFAKLEARVNKAREAFKNLAASEGVTSNQARRAQKEFERLDNRLAKINNRARDGRRDVGRYGKAIGRLRGGFISLTAAAGVTFGVFGAIRLIRNSIGIIRDFEKANATLSAILQVSKDSMTGLTDEAKRLGATTVRTASEVTQLQIAYARLGFTQDQIISLTEATINGSIALNAELDKTANLTGAVVNTMDEFNSTNAPEILDILSLATAKSALNFDKLEKGIPIVAGAANAAGLSFTQLIALMGKLADAGIDVSTSSTALRNIFIQSKAAGLDYQQILDFILQSQDKLTASNDAFGRRAAVSGAVLAANIDATKDLEAALENAAGTADRMAAKELDTLDGAIKLVISAWQGFILELDESSDIGKGLTGVLRFIAENMTTLINVVGYAIGAFAGYRIALGLVRLGLNAARLSQLSFAVAMRTGNALTIASAAILKAGRKALLLYDVAVKRTTVSMKIFNRTVRLNPIGLLLGLLAALGIALLSTGEAFANAAQKADDFAVKQKLISEVSERASDKFSEQIGKVRSLRRVLEDSNVSLDAKKAAYQELIRIHPQFAETLELDEDGHLKGAEAIDTYIAALRKKGRAQARQELAQEKQSQAAKEEARILKEVSETQEKSGLRRLNPFRSSSSGRGELEKAIRKRILDEQGAVEVARVGIDRRVTEAGKKAREQAKKEAQTILDELTFNPEEGLRRLTELPVEANSDLAKYIANLKKLNKEIDILNETNLNTEGEPRTPRRILDPRDPSGDSDTVAKSARRKAERERKRLEALRKKREEERLKALRRQREAIRVANELEVNDGLEKNQRIIKNEEASLQQRLEALARYNAGKLSLLNIAQNRELDKEGLTRQEIENINTKYDQLRLKQFQKTQDEKLKIIEETNGKEVALAIKRIDDLADKDTLELETEIADLDRQFARGLLSAEKYQKERDALLAIGGLSGVNAQIANLEELLDGESDLGDRRVEIERKVQHLKNEAAKIGADIRKTQLEQEQEAIEEFFDYVNQLSQIAGGILTEIAEAVYEQEEARLDARSKRLEREHEKEIDRIEQSGLKGKALEEAKRREEALTEAKRRQIDAQRAVALRKKARAEKAANILGITTGTAKAVVAALGSVPYTPANIALATATGLLGAAQLARAIAAPLPQYADGTDFHDGGRAIIGERGIELGILPSGKTFLSKPYAHEVDLPRGTKIKTAEETKEILAYAKPHVYTNPAKAKNEPTVIVDLSENTKALKGIERAVRESKTHVSVEGSERYSDIIRTIKRN